jgi:hypothetical protein
MDQLTHFFDDLDSSALNLFMVLGLLLYNLVRPEIDNLKIGTP